MFIITTNCPYLHPFYDDYLYDDTYFLGYTNDERIADFYLNHFNHIKEYSFNKISVNSSYIIKIKKLIPQFQRINAIKSYNKNFYFTCTESEELIIREYMEDDFDEFDDIKLSILNLQRFSNNSNINKLRKKLSKFVLEQIQSCNRNYDLAYTLNYYAHKIHLYDEKIYKYERCGK